jgi:hypothetical protein
MLFPPSVKFRVKFINLELLYKIVKHYWCFKTLLIKVNVASVDIGMQMAPNVSHSSQSELECFVIRRLQKNLKY